MVQVGGHHMSEVGVVLVFGVGIGDRVGGVQGRCVGNSGVVMVVCF